MSTTKRADFMQCSKRVEVWSIHVNECDARLVGKIIVHYPADLSKGRTHVTMYDWVDPNASHVSSDWTNNCGMSQVAAVLEGWKFGEVTLTANSWQSDIRDAGYVLYQLL